MNTISFEYPDQKVEMYGVCSICLSKEDIGRMMRELCAAQMEGREWVIVRVSQRFSGGYSFQKGTDLCGHL